MNWKELVHKYPQIFDSLWLFPKRGEGGDSKYHGAFIPQIVEYLLHRYTRPGDWVLDPFAGSGTTIDVCKKLGRNVFAMDLVPYRGDILQADARDILIGAEFVGQDEISIPTTIIYKMNAGPFKFDLTILHPPYADIIQFSNHPDDLSNCPDLPSYLEEMWKMAVNIDQFVKVKGHVALVLGDIYKDGQVVPLAFLIMQQWRARFPYYKLKAIYIKDIQGNVKDNTTNLWRSRHFKNGTAFFKHEYVFVFRKEREKSKNDSISWGLVGG